VSVDLSLSVRALLEEGQLMSNVLQSTTFKLHWWHLNLLWTWMWLRILTKYKHCPYKV